MTEPMEKQALFSFVPAQIVWHPVPQMKLPFPKFGSSDLRGGPDGDGQAFFLKLPAP